MPCFFLSTKNYVGFLENIWTKEGKAEFRETNTAIISFYIYGIDANTKEPVCLYEESMRTIFNLIDACDAAKECHYNKRDEMLEKQDKAFQAILDSIRQDNCFPYRMDNG